MITKRLKELKNLLIRYSPKTTTLPVGLAKETWVGGLLSMLDHDRGNEHIKAQLTQVVAEITDWSELLRMLGSAPSSLRAVVEAQMTRVIAEITNWDELEKMFDVPSSVYGNGREFINAQRARLVFAVTTKKCPKWFLDLLKNPEDEDCAVRAVLDNKAQELKDELFP